MSVFVEEEFEINPAQKFIAARARIAYLESWVSAQQTMGRPTFFKKEQTHKPLFLLLLIGLTSLSLYVVYRKKMY